MTDHRLLIDKNALDEALINNPSFIQEVCDEAAEAIAYRDAMKDALDTIEAELDVEIREITSKNKMTETAIKTTIQLRPERKKAFDAHNQAKLRAAKAAGLVTAAETRSKAIEGLSRLYTSGYYAIDSTKKSHATQGIEYNRLRERLASNRTKK